MYTSPKYKKHTTHIIMYKLQNQEEGKAPPPPSTPLGKNSNFSPFRNYFIIDRWFLHLNNHFPKKNYLNPSLQGFLFFLSETRLSSFLILMILEYHIIRLSTCTIIAGLISFKLRFARLLQLPKKYKHHLALAFKAVGKLPCLCLVKCKKESKLTMVYSSVM